MSLTQLKLSYLTYIETQIAINTGRAYQGKFLIDLHRALTATELAKVYQYFKNNFKTAQDHNGHQYALNFHTEVAKGGFYLWCEFITDFAA